MTEDLSELRGDGWTRLLAAARRSLERTGGVLEGSIGLRSPTEAERRVVIGITGRYRPETVRRLTVDLADLEAALRQRYGRGLCELLETLGGSLHDRPAERLRRQRQREVLVAAAGASPLSTESWYQGWLAGLRADGSITRLVRRNDPQLLDQAMRILELLHSRNGGTPVPLPVLAEQVTGDTKALLAGGTLATLVLRALALRAGLEAVPRDRAGQRALWESAGAIADDLASQVLVLNMGCTGSDIVSDWLNGAAENGIPFRLTLQQLAGSVVPSAEAIYVCENPAVLRVAAAELGADCPALVCTEGVPSAACHRLLGRAVARGARLHWRADFDWTGLRIVGAAHATHGALPWRMGAQDYLNALQTGESTPLTGSAVGSPWDPELASVMAEHGLTVMEERLITRLVAELSGDTGT